MSLDDALFGFRPQLFTPAGPAARRPRVGRDRFVGRRPGAGLHADGISPIVFTKGRADRRVRIELEDMPGEQRLELRCEVVVNVRLKSTIAQAFSSLESGQMPEGSSSPERPLGQLSPSGEIRGRIASIPMSLLPEHFQQFAATIQEQSRRGPDGYGILRRRPRSGSRCYP